MIVELRRALIDLPSWSLLLTPIMRIETLYLGFKLIVFYSIQYFANRLHLCRLLLYYGWDILKK